MTDNRREQIIDIIRKEFIGPDPLSDAPELIQENGEEILASDPPRIRYVAGILFPQKTVFEDNEMDSEFDEIESDDLEDIPKSVKDGTGTYQEYLEDAEELINLSNAYQQSAISLTVAVRDGDSLSASVKAGTYTTVTATNPETNKKITRYPRTPISWNYEGDKLPLPDVKNPIIDLNVVDKSLYLICTYRYKRKNATIFTFSLVNKKISTQGIRDEDCFFQAEFTLTSLNGFHALPDNERINEDEDFQSNQLLYRNVKNYALGHGCAADWQIKDGKVVSIYSSTFPTHEIKPIVPNAIPGVSLEMLKMSDVGDFNETLRELRFMCTQYKEWIERLKKVPIESKHQATANRHVANCEQCLLRMSDGISLLETNETVRQAFQFMNHAMLLQQLHYNLPLQTWVDDESGGIKLDNPITTFPIINKPETWFGEKSRYGKWRPFQLVFILINLRSMFDNTCPDRKKVDLIWFPTGGGKTEAYLGLSAYTIFIRRMRDRDDHGTSILMRYTLRLLTAQQYERASAMICACDLIRKKHADILGTHRITIGLWVGGDTTPNKMGDAVSDYNKLYNKTSDKNPFVMLKCPWCGAQMGVINKSNNTRETPGYSKVGGKKTKIVFQCGNKEHGCEFSQLGNGLPLYVVDEDIYENTPTLLLGTVDKFAMLPFRPQAQKLFGIDDGIKTTPPDLIIQDELHLISGPLGSMVGHYETLIHSLCEKNTPDSIISPKVIASTATISRAKEQCHALYGCGKENVSQFPPSGLNANDSFFAVEDQELDGRKYVGILATGSSSDTTTAIRLYAALLYAAKAVSVNSENERDPYWTNIGYFNSIRELGQAATWIQADITEYLHVIYKRRYEDKRKNEYRDRRYIYEDEELTSRIRSDKIPASLQKLGIRYPSAEGEKRPVDICLATNMISVGVDVPRLGLMTVSGQPKTTSEYIQATSRVGRSNNAPGIVFVLYRPGRPRDKSHYEHFISYHSRVYCNVEPTSVTPFSAPLRERALHAIMIGMLRLEGTKAFNSNPPKLPARVELERIKAIIEERVTDIDRDELEPTLQRMEEIIRDWEFWQPQKFHDFTSGNALPLMYMAGSRPNELWGNRSFPTPASMRNVDSSCEAEVLERGYWVEGV